MAKALTKIKNFMKVLNKTKKTGTEALDAAVKSVSKFSSWSQLISTMVSDCKSYAGNGTAFLQQMCGINLSNSDTGAITGSDAGGSFKTAESIVPESGSWKYPSKTTFKIQGLTVTVPEKSKLDSSQQYIVGALYTWWIKNSLSLIKKSFGLSFTDSGVSTKKLNVYFYNAPDGIAAYAGTGSGEKAQSLSLRINMRYFQGIENKKNPNGVGDEKTLTYLDRTIAHELTHATMAANIDYFNNLPTAFKEGSAELVHGIDDKRTSDIQNLASDSTKLRSAVYGGGITSYSAGYIALRYLAKQAAAGRKPNTSKNISSQVSENNFSENIAADELFEENNFVENSSLDEIISAKDFSVADVKKYLTQNIFSQDENIFQTAYSAKNETV